MTEQKLFHCDINDPKRCQSVGESTCLYLAMEGSRFCTRHGANKDIDRQERASVHSYQLACWQKRVNEHAENPTVKSLRGEIGILRMCLENLIVKCKDADDLFMYSNAISDLGTKIERIVMSCSKLESSTGQVLDKSMVIHFASKVVEIVDTVVRQYVKEPEIIVDNISSLILELLAGDKNGLSPVMAERPNKN